MKRRTRALVTGLVTLTVLPGLVFAGSAAAWSAEAIPDSPPGLDTAPLPTPLGVSKGLAGAKGTVQVTVRLSEQVVAETVAEGATAEGTVPSKATQTSRTAKVRAQQDGFVKKAKALGAKELGRSELAANVVAVSVDASKLDDLAAIADVIAVSPLAHYETDASDEPSGSLAQAVDYVQAKALHDAGFDGTGIRVAVVDSGVDFTHANLGGPGTVAAYDTCFAQASAAPSGPCAALFGPSAPKVKGGIDFVGDVWPNGAQTNDPNPIDYQGHGTHVADIIGGRSADGTHLGIAPGVDLYAVKVCSSVSTSCNGVALLQAMDWVLDPNGDGDVSDAMDVVNMSLGSAYGGEQDDLTFATDNVVRAGVVVVASAGNDADRPFIVGSPSTAAGAISVAQTALPDDKLWTIHPSTGADVTNAVYQAWSPLPTGVISGPLAVPAQNLGCDDAAFAGFPAGAIAVVARGVCSVSLKAAAASTAGAVAVVVYNNVAGDPPSFSYGGGTVTVPTLTVSLSAGQQLAAAAAQGATATIDPAQATSLANTVVGTSSRGVSVSGHRAKPDIGAPGAWLSAEVGTGAEETNFGGTSGAAPVVTGSAALVLDKLPGSTPAVVKARLLNGADSANRTPTANGFIPTPISRVGAGEVRAAPAASAVSVLATQGAGGNVGLGIPSVESLDLETVTLTLTNTSSASKKYSFDATFRDPADKATKAVTLTVLPSSVTVAKNSTKKVVLTVLINGSKLADWPFDFVGSNGDGSTLNGPEFDGWITATSGAEKLHVGWTVLPKKAADLDTLSTLKLDKKGKGTARFLNTSLVGTGSSDVYALTGTSPKLPAPAAGEPGSPGSNVALIDLAATGVWAGQGVARFALATNGRRTVLPYPAEFDVYVDSNRDGVDDYVVYNVEANGFGLSGQTLVAVANLTTGTSAAYYYSEGGFDSSTQVFTVPLAALGLAEGQTFDFSVYAFDNYFSGILTDAIEGQSFTVGAPKYTSDDSITLKPLKLGSLAVATNAAAGPSTQTGLLLVNHSAAKDDFTVVTVK